MHRQSKHTAAEVWNIYVSGINAGKLTSELFVWVGPILLLLRTKDYNGIILNTAKTCLKFNHILMV